MSNGICHHCIESANSGGQRTAVVNQIRGLLLERGITLRKGRQYFDHALPEILEEATSSLSAALRTLLADLKREADELTSRIERVDAMMTQAVREREACGRLVAIPGMGPVTAMGNGTAFTKGREFAAWLGLVPREHTTGGKQKLLGIRKRGNSYLRKLFVHGARAVMRFRAPQTSGLRAWLEPLTARTHHQVAIVALANKLARMAWAVLAKNERYRPPVVARLDTAAGGCGAKLVSQI